MDKDRFLTRDDTMLYKENDFSIVASFRFDFESVKCLGVLF